MILLNCFLLSFVQSTARRGFWQAAARMLAGCPCRINACFQDRQPPLLESLTTDGCICNAAISSNFQFTNEEPVIMIIRKGCWISHAGQITAGMPARRMQHLE